MNEGEGKREEEESGIKLLPMPGLLASSAKHGGVYGGGMGWGGVGESCLPGKPLGQSKLGMAGD